ncbi:MAG: M1 family metallopeptidase [Thermoanaerobaculia bacterium]|nr:M1 family metallopeptidase [Thermoanaerobaculia bacterium]
MSFRTVRPLLAALLTASAVASAQPPAEPAPGAPAAEGLPAAAPARGVVDYRIEARLDPATRLLEGRQVVTWRNLRSRPTQELWFHLYWNAWRNDRSTWMVEDRYRGRSDRGDDAEEEDWGYLVVDSATPQTATRFAAPDDGNPDDRTVWVVTLPEPVAPGESVRVELEWHARVPRTFARTGVRGDYFFVAHWFPKLGVWEEEGWNCHQYHAATEYFSDYGAYDVSLTLPSRFVVGATGRRTERTDHADGTSTHRYRQDDVHAFSWTASPDYLVVEDSFHSPGLPPVAIRLLLQPEHRRQADRHLHATRAALKLYGRWFGPYPYGHLTVVDPAWGSGAGGMEYPTLFTSGTRLFNPSGGGSPEGVTVHEAGHQFWYGLVGNNEFEHAWLDEGLNSYSTGRVMQETYGDSFVVRRFFRPPGLRGSGFLPWIYRDLPQSELIRPRRLDDYRRSARSDLPSRPTYRYFPATAGDITYDKSALWLVTLERHLGWPTMRRLLSAFFERSLYAHPTPEQFFALADEVSGRDLSWFFDQVHYGAAVFDYAVTSVKSAPVGRRGLFEEGQGLAYRDEAGDPEAGPFRSEVLIRRLEDGVFPVEVLLVFEDGSEHRESWDGEYLWKLIEVERPVKLAWAEVDPDHLLVLDVNRANNSRRLEPRARFPAVKWASKWLVWFQDLLHLFGSYV